MLCRNFLSQLIFIIATINQETHNAVSPRANDLAEIIELATDVMQQNKIMSAIHRGELASKNQG